MCSWFVTWAKKLKKSDYRLTMKFLRYIFTYNILPTTHKRNLIDDAAYLINAILDSQRIDIPLIICYMMIQAHELKHSINSLPYPTLVTSIMAIKKVSFKVTAKGCKDEHVVGHGTLKKMGLI